MITIPFIKLPRFFIAKKLREKIKDIKSPEASSEIKNTIENSYSNRERDTLDQHKLPVADETINHIKELIEIVRAVNLLLSEKSACYRFNIRTVYNEYFIEMLFFDDYGNIIESKKRNITHEEFTALLKHIETGEGILFEDTV